MHTNHARYTVTAIVIHWVVALLLLGVIALAYLSEAFPEESAQFALTMNLHKSIGVAILGLSLLRLLWRLFNKPPALPMKTPAWQKLSATVVMTTLYALTILTPMLGWAMSSADGHTTSFFGLFNLPNLIGLNENLAETLEEGHELFANLIIGLACLHVLAALKHHFIDKDHVLRQMRLK